jgi:hypothetical protein
MIFDPLWQPAFEGQLVQYTVATSLIDTLVHDREWKKLGEVMRGLDDYEPILCLSCLCSSLLRGGNTEREHREDVRRGKLCKIRGGCKVCVRFRRLFIKNGVLTFPGRPRYPGNTVYLRRYAGVEFPS